MKSIQSRLLSVDWEMAPKGEDFHDVPDQNFKRLLKAIKECPKTAEELRKKVELEEKKKVDRRGPKDRL